MSKHSFSRTLGRLPWQALLACALVFGLAASAQASFILDLTDADDHGSNTATENLDGWLYMEKVLDSLEPGVSNGEKTVVSLGSSSSAAAAAQSAFQFSTLASNGWNWVNIDGVADMQAFFAGTSATNINNTGIIQIDSGAPNVGGGIRSAELGVLSSNAGLINTFLGNGGGLHSMAEAGSAQYDWLSGLLPGLTFNTSGDTGLQLTAAGNSAFPGLSDSDLSAGPFHGHWTGGLGGLTPLFIDPDNGVAVGIGAFSGSITNPDPIGVPGPGSLLLFVTGLAMLGFGWNRKRRQ